MPPPLWPLIMLFEQRLFNALLKSPTFHAGVRQVHRRVHEMRHGKIEGGANEERPNRGGVKKFADLFWEELRSGFSNPRQPPK